MEKTITPSTVGGTITAPPGKSMGVRVAAAMALAGMQPTPREGDSDDVRAATRAAREWLAGSRTLHVGESALAANIFGCIAALSPEIMTITAEKTLLKRDMRELVHALRDARVGVRSEKFPMQLHGPMRGGSIRIFGPGSSQVVTGLLMALPLAPHDSVLEVRRPSSTPYIYDSRFAETVRHQDRVGAQARLWQPDLRQGGAGGLDLLNPRGAKILLPDRLCR